MIFTNMSGSIREQKGIFPADSPEYIYQAAGMVGEYIPGIAQ